MNVKEVSLRILAILLCIISVGFFAFIVYSAGSTEIYARKQSNRLVNVKSTSLPEQLIDFIIEDDIETAETILNQKDFKLNCDEKLYKYFENFFVYLKADKKSQIDEIYFIKTSDVVENYFKNQNYSEIKALRLSEQLPYYIAKNFIQNQKKNTTQTILFADDYIKHFAEFDSISEETADVICFYFYTYYNNSKTNKDWLKSEINAISEIQQHYSSYLGDNGNYTEQREYLKNFSNFLERKANSLIDRPSKLLTFWKRLENPPIYRF